MKTQINDSTIKHAASLLFMADNALRRSVWAHVCQAEKLLKQECERIGPADASEEAMAVVSLKNQVVQTREALGTVWAVMPGPDLVEAYAEFTSHPPVAEAGRRVA